MSTYPNVINKKYKELLYRHHLSDKAVSFDFLTRSEPFRLILVPRSLGNFSLLIKTYINQPSIYYSHNSESRMSLWPIKFSANLVVLSILISTFMMANRSFFRTDRTELSLPMHRCYFFAWRFYLFVCRWYFSYFIDSLEEVRKINTRDFPWQCWTDEVVAIKSKWNLDGLSERWCFFCKSESNCKIRQKLSAYCQFFT